MNTPNQSPSTPLNFTSGNPDPLYPSSVPESVQPLLVFAESLKAQIDQIKGQLHPESDLWATILQKMRVDWTYNSNAIEGSVLSRGETMFFLSEGLTVEGKPFKDFLDAKNHADAIDWLMDVIGQSRSITEGFIKDINALLLSGVAHSVAMTPTGERVKKRIHAGQYKPLPNHVQKQDGTLHQYVLPEQVPAQMQQLIEWIHREIDQIHPIVVAAIAHYNMVRIHPFDDGNGRGARILMNMILIQKGYFPAIIRRERKRHYLEALEAADTGDLIPFMTFIASQLIETQQSVLADLRHVQR